MILVVFHTAGINEKKYIIIMKKTFWYRTWATAQVSLRLGWALGWELGAGRAGAEQAQGARGVFVGSAGARWARALGARRQPQQACVSAEAWRAGRRAWARGQAQTGGSSARAQRARGRASGWRWCTGARGRRLGGRALGAGRTGPWAQARGACGAGAGSVRGIGRQGARLGAPGVLAGPVGGSCTLLDFQTGFSTRYFSRVTK